MSADFDRLRQELKSVLQGATEAALEKAPAGKWSSTQILEHLLLTYTGTGKGLAKCLEKGTPLATRATISQRIATLALLKTGYFPSGRKAPERTVPSGMPAERARQEIFAAIGAMASKLDDCERQFGRGTKILDHPVLGPLTAEQWRKFHWIHGRHHAKQIRQRIGKV